MHLMEKQGTTYGIWIPFVLLLLIGSLIIWRASFPLTEAMGVSPWYFIKDHLIHIGIGAVVLWGMVKVDERWFDRIGAGVLLLAVVAVLLMVFVPGMHEEKPFLKIDVFSVRPSLYFTLGVVWLFDYLERREMRFSWLLIVAMIGVWLVLGTAIDMPMMFFIGFVVLGMAWLRYGLSKVFLATVGSIVGIYLFLLFMSPHRLTRIQSWIHAISENGWSQTPPNGMALAVGKMHEGLFAYNAWGGVALAIVALLFVWLLITLWRVEHLFAKGVAILFGVSIVFHIVNFFGLLPLYPPLLWAVEYGESITFVSFLMMGMVFMRTKLLEEK